MSINVQGLTVGQKHCISRFETTYCIFWLWTLYQQTAFQVCFWAM